MESVTTKRNRCNKRKRCLGGCGSCCLLGALIVAFFWSSIFFYLLAWLFALSPNSITFNMWRETPLPMYMNVVLFNWTNPEQSLNGGEKPAFTEMGPYVFSEHHSKQNITWNSNDTITFLNRNEWHFLANLSSDSLSDVITNLNAVTLILGSRCHDLKDLSETVDRILKANGSLVVSKTAEELIFDGYEDNLLQNEELKNILPDFPDYDKFGWYYQRNMSDTYDGVITMYTGVSDIEKLGLLTSWNYQTRTNCYPDNCGKVQSTIGNVLPLSTFKQHQMTLFNTDICGTYTLDFEELVEFDNLPGVQYHATASMFNNSAETCYCPRQPCPAHGVRDISACKKGPFFISLPHFLNADPSYLEAVTGLNPDKEKHSFFMSLANLTSVPIVVRVRLQTNLLLEPVVNLTFFSNVTSAYIPMYWVDQYAILTPELAAMMHPLYTLSDWGRWYIFLFGGGIGVIFILLGIFLRCQG